MKLYTIRKDNARNSGFIRFFFLASVFLAFVLNQSYSHVLLSRFKDSTLVTTCELRSVA